MDRITAAIGQRPDLSLNRELRLDLDPLPESTKALCPLIYPNEHSCGLVPPHGHRELVHPEPDSTRSASRVMAARRPSCCSPVTSRSARSRRRSPVTRRRPMMSICSFRRPVSAPQTAMRQAPRVQDPTVAPVVKVALDGRERREVPGQQQPRSATCCQIQIAFMTLRRSVVRGRPRGLGSGRNGEISAHSRSVRSLE